MCTSVNPPIIYMSDGVYIRICVLVGFSVGCPFMVSVFCVCL